MSRIASYIFSMGPNKSQKHNCFDELAKLGSEFVVKNLDPVRGTESILSGLKC